MSLLTILLIILVICVCFGGFGQYRNWGPGYWSPVGLLLLVLLVLYLTGHIR